MGRIQAPLTKRLREEGPGYEVKHHSNLVPRPLKQRLGGKGLSTRLKVIADGFTKPVGSHIDIRTRGVEIVVQAPPKKRERGGTHCMRMRVVSVVTPTGFEEARAVCVIVEGGIHLRHKSRVVHVFVPLIGSLLQSCAC